MLLTVAHAASWDMLESCVSRCPGFLLGLELVVLWVEVHGHGHVLCQGLNCCLLYIASNPRSKAESGMSPYKLGDPTGLLGKP